MPNHIKYFEWTWLGSLALGIIVAALTYPTITPAGGEGVELPRLDIFVGFVQFFIFASLLLLILLISRKRSKVAKWILAIGFVIGVVFYIPQLSSLFEIGFAGVLSSIQVLAQCVGLYFLFTEESRNWFKQK
jgi:hypothetical protein